MQKQRDWGVRLGEMLAQRRGPMSQTTVAQLVGETAGRKVSQTLVSELERGNRWGQNFDLIGAFMKVLNIPGKEMQETIGIPVPPDDGEPQPRTFAEIVSADPTLSNAAKTHLLNQYELLQMATQHERSGDPVLHEDSASRPRRKRA